MASHEPEDLAAARQPPCACDCVRCDEGTHCYNRHKGCNWVTQIQRRQRPGSR